MSQKCKSFGMRYEGDKYKAKVEDTKLDQA